MDVPDFGTQNTAFINVETSNVVFLSIKYYLLQKYLQIANFYTLIWVCTTFAHGLASVECVRVNIKHNLLSFR